MKYDVLPLKVFIMLEWQVNEWSGLSKIQTSKYALGQILRNRINPYLYLFSYFVFVHNSSLNVFLPRH